jgi:hypothetical protein
MHPHEFRGYVGIEIQKYVQMIGINQTPENACLSENK